MNRTQLENIAVKSFNILVIVLFGILFWLSFTETWVNDWDLVSEQVFPIKDSVLINILGIVTILVLVSLFYQVAKRRKCSISVDAIAIFFTVMVLIFGIVWVVVSNAGIQADQLLVYNYAQSFNKGDFSGLQKGNYLGMYPQQLGLITIIRALLNLPGGLINSYRGFQFLNALMSAVAYYSGYRIVKNISKDNSLAETLYLLLMTLCVPLYGYIPFVYGEVGSTALVMFVAWMLLDILNQFSWMKMVFMTGAMCVAILYRENTLIFFIGFLIVAVIKLVSKPGNQGTSIVCSLLVAFLLSRLIIYCTYAEHIPEDSHGMPAILHITMGTNDDSAAAGWHNWYNQTVFRESDYDVAIATEIAKKDLDIFFQKCKKSPSYAVDFYYRKLSSQWNAPMYQCMAMTNVFNGGPNNVVTNIYYGDFRKPIEGMMNLYQLVVYGAILGLLFLSRKKWMAIENYLLLIGVFGGFLFTLIWEAKARYVFPYFVVMVPYAAVGICQCVKCLNGRWKK